jgi:hypothetical protein
VALLLLFLPTSLARAFANLLVVRILRFVRVRFFWVYASTLRLGSNARIGHFNANRVRRLVIGTNSAIGTLYWLSGEFSVALQEQAEIGARKVIRWAEVTRELALRIYVLADVQKSQMDIS